MFLNIQKLTLIILFLSGFSLFIINAHNLSLNIENIKPTKELKVSNNITKDFETKIESDSLLNNQVNIKKNQKFEEKAIYVKKGQTFSKILENFNFEKKRKFEIIKAINKIFDLRELKVNQKIIFFIDRNEVSKIIFELDFDTNLLVTINSKINVSKINLKTFLEVDSKEYLITNSIYSDGINNKIPNQVLIKLIQLFSFDLDFQRDIRKNTEVSVSYEKIFVKEKTEYSYGDIQYARIKIQNKTLEYFKFLTDDGFVDYFNREGKNVKKSILKTPLDGARLSSSFGMRKHPISGYNKMHKGIDFAAPIGTPVYAGGSGVVEFAGTNGGYGKYIRIRHNNEYKTAYAHLNKFKKGIGKGVRVNQGDIIGYVGSTGMSTGPHLHYEIIYQNKQINPLTLNLPSGKVLKNEEYERFKIKYKEILANHLNNLYE